MSLKTRAMCGILAIAGAAMPAAAQVYEGRTPATVQDEFWWRVYTVERSDDLRVPGQPETQGPDLYDWAYDYMYDDYYDFDEFPAMQDDPAIGAVRRTPTRVYGTQDRIYGTYDEWTPRTGEMREYGDVPRTTGRTPQDRTGRAQVVPGAGEYGIWSDYGDGRGRAYITDDDGFDAWYDGD